MRIKDHAHKLGDGTVEIVELNGERNSNCNYTEIDCRTFKTVRAEISNAAAVAAANGIGTRYGYFFVFFLHRNTMSSVQYELRGKHSFPSSLKRHHNPSAPQVFHWFFPPTYPLTTREGEIFRNFESFFVERTR